MERAAAANYMSLRTLHKLFAESGQTAAAWLRSRRIEAAKAALADPRDPSPVAAIAMRCGFSSISHFSQVFRGCTGVTPSEYREVTRSAVPSFPA